MSDEPGQREVAYRLFAAEYDDANLSYSRSDEERAPNYVITPTGARVNRLFVVGVLTEVEQVSDDVLRGRVVDPTGAFVLYAGQYQPDEQATLERTDPPAFVAVTGKADTFQPEDGDRVYTSIRPESINTVDAATRDRWTVQAAEQTLARVGHAATARTTGLVGDDLRETLADRGVEPALADGIPRALAHYDTTPAYLAELRELALDAARLVAGRRDEVREMTAAPDDPGEVTARELVAATPETDLEGDRPAPGESLSDTTTGAHTATEADASETEPGTVSGTETTSDSGAAPDPETASGAGDTDESSAVVEPDTVSESESAGEPERATGAVTDPGDATDDIAVAGDTDATGGDLGEFDSGEFELPDEVREEVEEAEEEFGTSFRSGTEIEEPDETEMQTSAETAPATEPESTEPSERTTDAGTAGAGAGDTGTASAGSGGAEAGDQSGSVEDPQAAVLAVMRDLDDGNGVDRAAVVTESRERHGLTDEEVTDAIQGALMDGRCYEPDESSLKPI